mmetsp:Transcript_94785/g.267595  ORF Transcript_94785/g.267595 Transcript_94785/m.267595 type:complete len:227 (-) Transcript_94785:1380-2060(-)
MALLSYFAPTKPSVGFSTTDSGSPLFSSGGDGAGIVTVSGLHDLASRTRRSRGFAPSAGGGGAAGRVWGMSATFWPQLSSDARGAAQSSLYVTGLQGVSGAANESGASSASSNLRASTSSRGKIFQLLAPALPEKSKMEFHKFRFASKWRPANWATHFGNAAAHGQNLRSSDISMIGSVFEYRLKMQSVHSRVRNCCDAIQKVHFSQLRTNTADSHGAKRMLHPLQ